MPNIKALGALIRRLFSAEVKGITPAEALTMATALVERRALHMSEVSERLSQWSYSQPGLYLYNLYFESDGSLYALFSGSGGRNYRALVTVADSDVSVGELEEVEHTYTPVQRSTMTIFRMDDGAIRFFLIAGTSVINRSGQIDSTTLFDNMIQRAEEMQLYPKLDYAHLGEFHPIFEFGQFDWLAREGVTYLASGTMDPEHPITRAVLRKQEEDPGYLGASIEFYPIKGTSEAIEVDGVPVEVYLDGVNTRISLLPEREAAAWFTSLTTVQRQQEDVMEMTERQLAMLQELFKGHEDELRTVLVNVGQVNAEVAQRKLVHRNVETPAEGQEGQEAAQPAAQTNLVIDDTVVDVIAERVLARMGANVPEAVSGQFAQFSGTLETLTTTLTAINGRLAAVEASDEAKKRTWLADLPQQTVVTYQPRQERAAAAATPEPAKKTAADQAASVLASLPKVPR